MRASYDCLVPPFTINGEGLFYALPRIVARSALKPLSQCGSAGISNPAIFSLAGIVCWIPGSFGSAEDCFRARDKGSSRDLRYVRSLILLPEL